MKLTIALIISTTISFTVFFMAANAIEKQPEESGLVERVVKTYAEKMPEQQFELIGKSDLPPDSTNLNIETTSDDIILVKAEQSGKIEVYGTKKAQAPIFIKNKNEFKLEYDSQDKGITWGFRFNNTKVGSFSGVKVFVPEHIKTITLTTSSGDIKYSDLNIETLIFTTSSGDVKIKNSNAKQIKLVSSSGDHRIEMSVSSLEAATSSGDQILNLTNCIDLSAIASSGDIRMESSCEINSITTSSGDITVEEKGTSKKMNILSSSGDIRIKYRTATPSAIVSFTTHSGDLSTSRLKEAITQKVDENNFTLNNGTSLLNVTTSSGDVRLSKKID